MAKSYDYLVDCIQSHKSIWVDTWLQLHCAGGLGAQEIVLYRSVGNNHKIVIMATVYELAVLKTTS